MVSHRFLAALTTTIILMVPIAHADSLIRLQCTVAPDWINKAIEASTKTPKPTREWIIQYFRTGNMYKIEVSFQDDKQLVGVGTFLGQEVGYFAAESGVVFLIPGQPGSDKAPSATLDRFKGRMLVQYPDAPPIEYVCSRMNRKF